MRYPKHVQLAIDKQAKERKKVRREQKAKKSEEAKPKDDKK